MIREFDITEYLLNRLEITQDDDNFLILKYFISPKNLLFLIASLIILIAVEISAIFLYGYDFFPVFVYPLYNLSIIAIVYILKRKKEVVFNKKEQKVIIKITPFKRVETINFSDISEVYINYNIKFRYIDDNVKFEYIDDKNCKIEYCEVFLMLKNKKKIYIETFNNYSEDKMYSLIKKISDFVNTPINDKNYINRSKHLTKAKNKKRSANKLLLLMYLIIMLCLYFLESESGFKTLYLSMFLFGLFMIYVAFYHKQ